MFIVPQLMEALRSQSRSDIIVALGGVVPPEDYEQMYTSGIAAIFGPGTPIAKAAGEILSLLGNVKSS